MEALFQAFAEMTTDYVHVLAAIRLVVKMFNYIFIGKKKVNIINWDRLVSLNQADRFRSSVCILKSEPSGFEVEVRTPTTRRPAGLYTTIGAL